mgnify:CR=1 FL=1
MWILYCSVMLESGKMGNVCQEGYSNHEMNSGPVVLCHYSIPTVELSDSAVLAPVPILEKQPRVEKADVKEEGYTSGEEDKKT